MRELLSICWNCPRCGRYTLGPQNAFRDTDGRLYFMRGRRRHRVGAPRSCCNCSAPGYTLTMLDPPIPAFDPSDAADALGRTHWRRSRPQ